MKMKVTLLIALSITILCSFTLLGAVEASAVPQEETEEVAPSTTVVTTTSITTTTVATTTTTKPVVVEKYADAKFVWDWLIARGWSEEAAAGVLGNLMAETGGRTLNLDWDSEGGCGYGLFQWIGQRRVDLKAKYGVQPNIEQQLQFMVDELYGTDGVRIQVSAEQRNVILNSATPEECAYAFACYYERCHKNYRWFRRDLARTAYNYFTQK